MDLDCKTLELDKICRVCLTAKKDMRPLFGEMVAEMLMEFSQVEVIQSGYQNQNIEKKQRSCVIFDWFLIFFVFSL